MEQSEIFFKGIHYCTYHYKQHVTQGVTDIGVRTSPRPDLIEELVCHILMRGDSSFTSVTRSRNIAESYAKMRHGFVLHVRPEAARLLDPVEELERALRGGGVQGKDREVVENALNQAESDQELLVRDGIRRDEVVYWDTCGTPPKEPCDGRD